MRSLLVSILAATCFAPATLAQEPRRDVETGTAQPAERAAVVMRAELVPQATPVERRTYHRHWRDLAGQGSEPAYRCEVNGAGEQTSCWCNFNDSPQDCANMLVGYCGDAPTWTSDVPGELGCDAGTAD